MPPPAHTSTLTFLPAFSRKGAGTPGLRRIVKIGAQVSVGDDAPVPSGGSDPSPAGLLVANPAPGTGLILFPRATALPSVWVGSMPAAGLTPDDAAALLGAVRPCSLLPEHGEGWFGRPGLSGHRLGQNAGGPAAGRDWSPLFRPTRSEHARSEHARPEHARPEHAGDWARVEAADKTAGLELVTEIEAVPGGAIRARHTLTNAGRRHRGGTVRPRRRLVRRTPQRRDWPG